MVSTCSQPGRSDFSCCIPPRHARLRACMVLIWGPGNVSHRAAAVHRTYGALLASLLVRFQARKGDPAWSPKRWSHCTDSILEEIGTPMQSPLLPSPNLDGR